MGQVAGIVIGDLDRQLVAFRLRPAGPAVQLGEELAQVTDLAAERGGPRRPAGPVPS